MALLSGAPLGGFSVYSIHVDTMEQGDCHSPQGRLLASTPHPHCVLGWHLRVAPRPRPSRKEPPCCGTAQPTSPPPAGRTLHKTHRPRVWYQTDGVTVGITARPLLK